MVVQVGRGCWRDVCDRAQRRNHLRGESVALTVDVVRQSRQAPLEWYRQALVLIGEGEVGGKSELLRFRPDATTAQQVTRTFGEATDDLCVLSATLYDNWDEPEKHGP